MRLKARPPWSCLPAGGEFAHASGRQLRFSRISMARTGRGGGGKTDLPVCAEHGWPRGRRRRAAEANRDRAGRPRNRIALDLPSMQLRDFSKGTRGVATLICAPFALHRSTIADFARHHSLVEALRAAGIHRLHLTDWRSASPEMRFLSIDGLLADLNVAVDHLGGAVDLIGICQGGWMSLALCGAFSRQGAEARDRRCSGRSGSRRVASFGGGEGSSTVIVRGSGRARRRSCARTANARALGFGRSRLRLHSTDPAMPGR